MVDQKRVEVSGLAYPWICFFSLKDGKKYYVNASTGSSQWHKPPDAKKDSMRIYTETDLPYPFIALKSASKGQAYYSDARTRKSVWERPKVAALEPPGPPPEAPPVPGPGGDASTSSSTTSIPAAAPVKRELKRSFQKSSADNEQPSKTSSSADEEKRMDIEPVRNEKVRDQSNAASTSKLIKTEPGLKRRPVETKQTEIQVQHLSSNVNNMQCADVDMPTYTSNSDAKHMSKEMEELLQRLEQEYVEENTHKTVVKSEPVPVWDAVVKQQQTKNTKSPPKKKQPPKDQKLRQSPRKNQKKDQKPPLPLKSQKSPQKKPIKLADITFPALPSQPQSSQRNSEKVSGVAFPAVPPQDIHYPGSVYDSFDFVLPNGPRPGMKPTKRAQKPQQSAVKQPLDRLLLPKLLSLKPCPSFNKKSEKPQPSAVKQPLDRLLLPKLLSLKPCPSFNKKSEKKVHPAPPSIRPREPPAVTARPTEAEKKEQVQDVLKELRRIVVGTTPPMDADAKLLKADMKAGDPSCSTDVEMMDVDISGEVQMLRRGAEESDSKPTGSSSTSDMAISSTEMKTETKVEVQKAENQMIPFVVVTDTSALVESVDTLPRLVKRDIFTYIPHAVIRELDNLKSVEETPKQRSLAARTRTVVNQIFSYTQDTEPTFAECVVLESNQAGNAPLSGFDCTSNDDRILRAAVRLKHILREQAAGLQVPVILLTNDRILCLKATAYAEQGVFGTNWQGLEKHIQEWKQGKGLIFSMPSSSKCSTENPKLRLSEEADRMPSPPRSRKAKNNRFKEALYDTSVPAPTMLAVVKDELRPIESQLEHFKTIVKQTVDELLRRFHDPAVSREQKEAFVLRMTDIRTSARCSCDFPSKYNLFVSFMGAINKAFRFMDGPPEYTAKVGNLKLLHQHILVQHPDVFSDLSNLAHSQEFQIELGISSSDYGF